MLTTPEISAILAIGAGVGATIPLAIACLAGAIVPCAMSFFGTIVPGKGTIHSASGVAASCQWVASKFCSIRAVLCGAAAGIIVLTTTQKVVIGAAVGTAIHLVIVCGAGVAVPYAMSYFGTIVPGVGTIHAAGGVAATSQWAATAFWSTSAFVSRAAGTAAFTGK
ncbi:hypothetical protein THRCLA_04044 [Thraustotheca clavata]|uniref:Interferon-induced 6-16 family n=1 Tax=Thraustotheca clavata TaxID=74557 RepID=A0A1W0A0U4_9STRA|nr:hypothetical protein THRCLA_04044 [Thraustotheca clavata]